MSNLDRINMQSEIDRLERDLASAEQSVRLAKPIVAEKNARIADLEDKLASARAEAARERTVLAETHENAVQDIRADHDRIVADLRQKLAKAEVEMLRLRGEVSDRNARALAGDLAAAAFDAEYQRAETAEAKLTTANATIDLLRYQHKGDKVELNANLDVLRESLAESEAQFDPLLTAQISAARERAEAKLREWAREAAEDVRAANRTDGRVRVGEVNAKWQRRAEGGES